LVVIIARPIPVVDESERIEIPCSVETGDLPALVLTIELPGPCSFFVQFSSCFLQGRRRCVVVSPEHVNGTSLTDRENR
jgi:hypothetical protein